MRYCLVCGLLARYMSDPATPSPSSNGPSLNELRTTRKDPAVRRQGRSSRAISINVSMHTVRIGSSGFSAALTIARTILCLRGIRLLNSRPIGSANPLCGRSSYSPGIGGGKTTTARNNRNACSLSNTALASLVNVLPSASPTFHSPHNDPLNPSPNHTPPSPPIKTIPQYPIRCSPSLETRRITQKRHHSPNDIPFKSGIQLRTSLEQIPKAMETLIRPIRALALPDFHQHPQCRASSLSQHGRVLILLKWRGHHPHGRARARPVRRVTTPRAGNLRPNASRQERRTR